MQPCSRDIPSEQRPQGHKLSCVKARHPLSRACILNAKPAGRQAACLEVLALSCSTYFSFTREDKQVEGLCHAVLHGQNIWVSSGAEIMARVFWGSGLVKYP